VLNCSLNSKVDFWQGNLTNYSLSICFQICTGIIINVISIHPQVKSCSCYYITNGRHKVKLQYSATKTHRFPVPSLAAPALGAVDISMRHDVMVNDGMTTLGLRSTPSNKQRIKVFFFSLSLSPFATHFLHPPVTHQAQRYLHLLPHRGQGCATGGLASSTTKKGRRETREQNSGHVGK